MKTYIVILGFLALLETNSKDYATIQASTTHILILSKERAEITKKYVIDILDEKGYRMAYYYDYYDEFRKIKSIEATIYDSKGEKVKKLTKADAYDYAFNSAYETVDTRQILLDPQYKQFPFRIDMEVKIVLDGFINLPTWLPRPYFDLAVRRSKLIVDVKDPEYELRMKEEFMEDVTFTNGSYFKKQYFEYNRYKWEVDSLASMPSNMTYKTFFDSQPKVYLAPSKFEFGGYAGQIESWLDFGDWFLDVNRGRDEFSLKTKNYLDSLNSLSTEQTIFEIYKYMQDKTRYVSIQLGIGGYQSLPASVVDENGYGDCKALTTYMKAMLEYKGLDANYILVRAGRDVPEVNEDFPSNQFNHVFLGVPIEGDTIMLECTSQEFPPNYIGTFTDDRNVLWVGTNESKIIRTPTYSELENVLKKKGKLQIDSDGNGKLTLTTDHQGVFYDNISIYKNITSSQVERYNYGLFTYKDFTIASYENTEVADKAEFSSRFDLEINNIAKNTSSKLLLPINVLQSLDKYVKADRYTKFAEVKRGFTLEEEVDATLPENYWIQRLPENKSLETEYGSYSVTIEYEGDSMLIKRKVVIKKGRYELDSFDSFYAFFRKVKRMDETKLVLESKT
ncbi:MAG: DUF3857 domain-containing protein [Cyclobacteriaceae bacterium]